MSEFKVHAHGYIAESYPQALVPWLYLVRALALPPPLVSTNDLPKPEP